VAAGGNDVLSPRPACETTGRLRTGRPGQDRRTLSLAEVPRSFFSARVSRANVAAAMLEEAENGGYPGRTRSPVDR
jgi:hypothetical protein